MNKRYIIIIIKKNMINYLKLFICIELLWHYIHNFYFRLSKSLGHYFYTTTPAIFLIYTTMNDEENVVSTLYVSNC